MTPESVGARQESHWPLLLVLAGWILLAACAFATGHGPAPVSVADAEAARFCGVRALETVRTLVGDGIPHPAGSLQNDVVRQRLVDLASEAGYAVELQHSSAPLRGDASLPTVPLENVLFHLEADRPEGERLLLAVVSHYDSSPNGPGASDAASGVAVVLEVARLMKLLPGRRHDVVFLLTDGEESGLLGAERFLEEHRLGREVDLCINLEARGTTGPSLMFQTGEPSLRLVRLMAGHLERPFTGSLFDAVYRHLPNNTDFTVFQNAGVSGFNFAFIGDVRNYHTSDDDIAHLDPRSLQHHGDNAWQMARALVTDPDPSVWPTAAESSPRNRAVWFDLLGCCVLWWPECWSVPAALLAVVLIVWRAGCLEIAGTGNARFRFPAGIRRLVLRAAEVVAMTAMGAGLSTLMIVLLRMDDRFRPPWPDQTVVLLLLLALALTPAAVATGWTGLRNPEWCAARRAGDWLLGQSLVWALLALLTAGLVPGAAYLFLVPALAGAAAAQFAGGIQARSWIPAMLPAVVGGTIWLWLVPSLFDALGFRHLLVWPMVLAVLGSTLIPVIGWVGKSRSRVGAAVLACLVFASLLGLVFGSP